jgi:hypothetical protein
MRLAAAGILMSICYGADLHVIETDPDPNVIGARLGYRWNTDWEFRPPPPHRELVYLFSGLLPYFRHTIDIPSGRIGILPIFLCRQVGEVVVIERERGSDRSVTYQIPRLPGYEIDARQALNFVSIGPEYLIEFDHSKD